MKHSTRLSLSAEIVMMLKGVWNQWFTCFLIWKVWTLINRCPFFFCYSLSDWRQGNKRCCLSEGSDPLKNKGVSQERTGLLLKGPQVSLWLLTCFFFFFTLDAGCCVSEIRGGASLGTVAGQTSGQTGRSTFVTSWWLMVAAKEFSGWNTAIS